MAETNSFSQNYCSINILDYIDELIEQGYSEEDAERCADCLFAELIEVEDIIPFLDDSYYGE